MRCAFVFSFASLAVATLLCSCGGGPKSDPKSRLLAEQPDNIDPIASITGIDEKTAVAIEPDKPAEKPEEQAAAPNPDEEEEIGGKGGALLATLLLNGEEISGHFTVKKATAQGDVVMQKVATGKDCMLEPGKYDFVFKTHDKIVGDPEMTLRDVVIPAGKRIKRKVKFPVGQITLITGANCVKKPIKIKQKGATDWYKGKFVTCEPITLLSGEYEAEMGDKKTVTPISGIQVYDGGSRDVLIRPK